MLTTAPHDRLDSMDALRGLAVVLAAPWITLLALAQPPGVSDPLDLNAIPFPETVIYLLGHLCPAIFMLLAGAAVQLDAARHDRSRLHQMYRLGGRIVLLLAIEMTIVSMLLNEALVASHVELTLLWIIPAGYLVLLGAVWLPPALSTVAGATLIGLLPLVPATPPHGMDALASAWTLLFQPGTILVPDLWFDIRVTTPAAGWIGIMLLGYGLAPLIAEDHGTARNRRLVMLGLGLLGAFLALRLGGLYGGREPMSWSPDTVATVLSALNTGRFPPSLHHLLMVLAPLPLLLALYDTRYGRVTRGLALLGRGSLPAFLVVLMGAFGARIYFAGAPLTTAWDVGVAAAALLALGLAAAAPQAVPRSPR